MKKIGIKLADGTFYPILEEGEPKTRNLDLTTAKDNQTQVQIDLYRSENDSIEGAEYVDTLVIKHMKKHPEGEPDLHLSIGIDENNELTARVVDDETGKESEVTCQLVSRTLQEREEEEGTDVTAAEVSDTDISDAGAGDSLDDSLDEPFSFDNVDTDLGSDLDLPSFEETDFTVTEDPSISEASPENSDVASDDENVDTVDNVDFGDVEDTAVGNVSIVPDFDDLGDLGDFGDTGSNEEAPVEEETVAEEPVVEETVEEEPAFDDMPNIDDMPSFDETPAEEPAEDTTETSIEDEFSTDGLDLPDFGDTPTEEPAFEEESVVTEDAPEESLEDSFNTDDLDLPDFGDISDETSDTTDSSATDDFSNDDFSIPDFDDLDSTFNSLDTEDETSDNSDMLAEKVKPGSSMDFSDLYDENTLESGSAGDETVERKTRAPVVICVVCAIICLLATALVLFIVPSKYNLLNKFGKSNETVITSDTGTLAEEIVAIEAERIAAEKAAKEAKEAAEKAEAERRAAEEAAQKAAEEAARKAAEIVPVPVEPKPKKEVKKVMYKIKWGDTLWDISESYYKTPWKYKKIADHNKIKNPDVIISGTTIEIPE